MKRMQFMMIWGLCFLIFSSVNSQENQNQAFWIHEDQVKPGLVEEYADHSKKLVAMAKENNFEGMGWNVAQMDDGTFLSITPIEDFEHLQSLSFASLQEKVGQENFSQLMSGFNKYYDYHGDYITILDNDLSYMPSGEGIVQDGKDFRKWHFMKVTAENDSKMREKLKELKDLYGKKNSKMHYRVYRSGFGQMGNNYVAVLSAKDAQDYARLSAENNQILGEEGKQKFQEIMDLVTEYRNTQGRMRPDLAYIPTAAAAQPIQKD
ncbi:hypothetical protein ACXYMT_08760 [Salinimicrobium sp. CAU 1759]